VRLSKCPVIHSTIFSTFSSEIIGGLPVRGRVRRSELRFNHFKAVVRFTWAIALLLNNCILVLQDRETERAVESCAPCGLSSVRVPSFQIVSIELVRFGRSECNREYIEVVVESARNNGKELGSPPCRRCSSVLETPFRTLVKTLLDRGGAIPKIPVQRDNVQDKSA
jgi:hypothetical protein